MADEQVTLFFVTASDLLELTGTPRLKIDTEAGRKLVTVIAVFKRITIQSQRRVIASSRLAWSIKQDAVP